MPLNPPIDTLDAAELEAVVKIMRESGDLGAANRALRERYPSWDTPRRSAALRAGQHALFRAWERSPARKRRAQLVSGRGEEHKEGAPERGA